MKCNTSHCEHPDYTRRVRQGVDRVVYGYQRQKGVAGFRGRPVPCAVNQQSALLATFHDGIENRVTFASVTPAGYVRYRTVGPADIGAR
jgi:hypothetical protein